MTSDVMTDLDREVIIYACKQFWSWIEAVMEPTLLQGLLKMKLSSGKLQF
jgi:hypothetical protein